MACCKTPDRPGFYWLQTKLGVKHFEEVVKVVSHGDDLYVMYPGDEEDERIGMVRGHWSERLVPWFNMQNLTTQTMRGCGCDVREV
jgi:hypothetical protein